VWCFTGFASLFPILFAALYWKRSNKQGAIAGVLTVAGLWLYGLFAVLKGGEVLLRDLFPQSLHESIGPPGAMMPVAVIVTLATAVMVIVTLLTPPPEDEIVDKFFPAKN
jgi:SSS family solute:Na+ symporter